MAKTLVLDPLTRIEGHMKIETEVGGGQVTSARVAGEMFRGFENFLQGRHPYDAARIAQRVCGVCHEVHGVASIKALEELYQVTPPPNGRILRDLILGLHLASDHILHFYTLSLPDYVDFTKILAYKGNDPRILAVIDWVKSDQPRFILDRNEGEYYDDPEGSIAMVADYLDTISIRQEAGAGMAVLGAKVPFTHALLPGGLTTKVEVETLARYRAALSKTYDFIVNRYIPSAMTIAKAFPHYFKIGKTHGNLYANATFEELGTPLFPGRVRLNGSFEPFDIANVSERIDRSWYSRGTDPDPKKAGAYSWIKAPRYKGEPLEVGPFARMALRNDPEFLKAMKSLGVASSGKAENLVSSTMARVVARAYEAKLLCEHCFGLLDRYKLDEPTFVENDLSRPVTGKGLGLSIAARGALIHQVEAENGKIKNYNMIVPSTWNFGPSDNQYRGVVEEAILGTPVRNAGPDAIEVGRVVRSFDPCTACAVH